VRDAPQPQRGDDRPWLKSVDERPKCVGVDQRGQELVNRFLFARCAFHLDEALGLTTIHSPAAVIHRMQGLEYRQASVHIHNDGGQSREDLHGLRLW
jgi:hypothetical protein